MAQNFELSFCRVPRIPYLCGSLLTLTHTFQLPLGEAELLTTCVNTALGDSECQSFPLHFKKHCRGVGRQNHGDTHFSILRLITSTPDVLVGHTGKTSDGVENWNENCHSKAFHSIRSCSISSPFPSSFWKGSEPFVEDRAPCECSKSLTKASFW